MFSASSLPIERSNIKGLKGHDFLKADFFLKALCNSIFPLQTITQVYLSFESLSLIEVSLKEFLLSKSSWEFL